MTDSDGVETLSESQLLLFAQFLKEEHEEKHWTEIKDVRTIQTCDVHVLEHSVDRHGVLGHLSSDLGQWLIAEI